MIGTLNAVIRQTFLIMLAMSPFNVVHAIESVPEVINMPVPPEWRIPLSRFLSELGAADIEATLNSTKAAHFPGDDPALMVFRVQASGTCSANYDECLTIVARIANGSLVKDAMFFAGNRMNRADVGFDFLGTQSFPVRFFSAASRVFLIKTAKGFLVTVGKPDPSL